MTMVQIDQSMLEQFRMLERAGKPGVLKQMVGMFLRGSAEQIAAIVAASAAADGEKLRVTSHTLKSNAASFGATALADACREIEYAAKAGTCTLAADALERLRELHQASCVELQRAVE